MNDQQLHFALITKLKRDGFAETVEMLVKALRDLADMNLAKDDNQGAARCEDWAQALEAVEG